MELGCREEWDQQATGAKRQEKGERGDHQAGGRRVEKTRGVKFHVGLLCENGRRSARCKMEEYLNTKDVRMRRTWTKMRGG